MSDNISAADKSLLQSFVPINTLSLDHLDSLLRDRSIEVLCAGQNIFTAGECDNQHIYLLHGDVELLHADGTAEHLSAESHLCTFPIAHVQPRQHSARAVTDCSVIRFDSAKIDGMIAWDQTANYIMLAIAAQRDLDEDAEWMATLLRSNLFYKVPPINIEQILHRFEPVTVAAEDFVLRQGELGDCCYVIKEGEAEVWQALQPGEPQVLVATLSAGRCFGEDALVNDAPRNATVRMKSNGVLMRLDKQDFFLLLKDPDITTMSLSEASQQTSQGDVWIDVRTQEEYDAGHCAQAVHMPLDILQLKARLLDKTVNYIAYCNCGQRSQAAAHFLQGLGYQVHALAGGFKRYPPDQRSNYLELCF